MKHKKTNIVSFLRIIIIFHSCIFLTFGPFISDSAINVFPPSFLNKKLCEQTKSIVAITYQKPNNFHFPRFVQVDDDYNQLTPGWGYDHFDSIQNGINMVCKGGVVYVHAGFYIENIKIYKSLKLIGENRNTTIIDGNNSGDAVKITDDEVVISGFTIKNSGCNASWPEYDAGIEIDASNTAVTNCDISNNYIGVYTTKSSYNSIIHNTISDGTYGIFCYSSVYSTNIIRNKISKNSYAGVYLADSIESNTISNNIFIENTEGITLYGGTKNQIIKNTFEENQGPAINVVVSKNNQIASNDIKNTTGAGISLAISSQNTISKNLICENGEYAISLYKSSKNNIIENECVYNKIGVFLISSSENTLIKNQIEKNKEYGIYLTSYANGKSNFNKIFYNSFKNNSINAYDQCLNIWNSSYPRGGNYWSDYNGTDVYHGPKQNLLGRDGIGDTPYYIPDGSNRDNYPLMHPIKK